MSRQTSVFRKKIIKSPSYGRLVWTSCPCSGTGWMMDYTMPGWNWGAFVWVNMSNG